MSHNNMIAIVSDIHSNYEAISAVISDIEKEGATGVITLGDNIGYGPDPNQVVSLLKINGIISIQGNHEAAIINEKLLPFFNPAAKEALIKTKKIITKNTLEEIKNYPDFIIKYGCRFIHGAPPDEIHTYIFEISPDGFKERFKQYEEKICFTGHTHRFGLIEYADDTISSFKLSENKETKLDPEKRYIINCGSVGQPRETDKRAGYIIFDPENLKLRVKRVKYDRNKTRRKILNRGFPAVYAGMI